MDIQLTPGYLLVRHGAGIRAIRGRRVRDLAEIAPEGNVVPFQVLVHHGDHADGEVARDAAADLEKAYPFTAAVHDTSPRARSCIRCRFSR